MTKTGPRRKIVRRLGAPLPGLTRKEAGRKAYPPGEHGPGRRRRRKSRYRERLEEKQKVRLNYGLKEKQLRNYFDRARAHDEPTGRALLEILERRLDNVVFRLGFARTIPAARQLVVHGHILVEGRGTDRPGYETSSGEEIALTDRARKITHVIESVEAGPVLRLPEHLELDPEDPYSGRVLGSPLREDVSVLVDEAEIVEFYAR